MSARRRSVPPAALALALAGFALLIALPLAGLLARAPWSSLGSHLGSAEALTALRVSLVVAAGAAGVSLTFGVPLAWLLARTSFPGLSVLRALTFVPLVLPPVVGGVALLLAFGRRGIAGQLLDTWFGIRLPFTMPGAVLAGAFVAMPFLVLTVESGFRAVDERLEETAATLGAGRWTVFRTVTLPLAAPSLVAGTALAWARALGEFGATITFAGNFQGRTQTLPLAVFLALETNPAAAIAMSLLLLAISVAVLVALRPRAGLFTLKPWR